MAYDKKKIFDQAKEMIDSFTLVEIGNLHINKKIFYN